MRQDIRWKQRFDNFDRAFHLLTEVFNMDPAVISPLEKEGAIQRFEIAFELAWKTIKDYLENEGIIVDPVTPRNVIKIAFSSKLLDDAQIWIEMMNHRNSLSHTYSARLLHDALLTLNSRYYPAFQKLHTFFLSKKDLP